MDGIAPVPSLKISLQLPRKSISSSCKSETSKEKLLTLHSIPSLKEFSTLIREEGQFGLRPIDAAIWLSPFEDTETKEQTHEDAAAAARAELQTPSPNPVSPNLAIGTSDDTPTTTATLTPASPSTSKPNEPTLPSSVDPNGTSKDDPALQGSVTVTAVDGIADTEQHSKGSSDKNESKTDISDDSEGSGNENETKTDFSDDVSMPSNRDPPTCLGEPVYTAHFHEAMQRATSENSTPYLIKVCAKKLKPFSIACDEDGDTKPYSLLELAMMKLSAAIRLKPEWRRKRLDPTIVSKWTKEALEDELHGLSSEAVAYVMDELELYALLSDDVESGGIEPGSVDGTYVSDALIPGDLASALKEAVRPLEEVPEEEIDWHPGSQRRVQDLVHPSLFPLMYDKSRRIKAKFDPAKPLTAEQQMGMTGKGKEVASLAEWDSHLTEKQIRYIKSFVSQKYSWLPTDVYISAKGEAKFHSYINNIHPIKNRELVLVIERIFERFVPLFERVLSDIANPRDRRIDCCGDWYPREYDSDLDRHGSENEDEAYERFAETRELIIPQPGKFSLPASRHVVFLNGTRLQVIVKLANIVLTPEQPDYSGGVWHIEGMINETIISTGIFYYDCDNITESRLAFRAAVMDPPYEQNDDRGVETVYGLPNESAMNQELGCLITKKGRCIAFPNSYQHKVQPFELIDKSRRGTRKILVFFLIDPTREVPSTLSVPPQQAAWWSAENLPVPKLALLPTTVVNIIFSFLDYPLSMEVAKQVREDLMSERKTFIDRQTEEVFDRPFSLCEH